MLNKLSGFGKKMYCGFKNCFLHSSDNFTKELKLLRKEQKFLVYDIKVVLSAVIIKDV